MRLYSIFTLLLCLSLYATANDCSSAATLTVGNTTTLSFDNLVDYSPRGGQQPCNTTSPTGDAWFEYIPGGNNTTNYDMDFLISINYSGRINIALIYSESVDAGNPCWWDVGTTEGYTYYNTVCDKQMNGTGHTYFFRNRAIDGSGHYFILIERLTGSGGTVSVRPRILGTCSAPTNDRCATPTVLSSGTGIDPNTSTSSIVSWTVSAAASTKCATKQRMDDGCQPGGAAPTEDHYGTRLGACYWNGNVGDIGSPPFRINTCDEYLENTVWYSFQVPFSQSNWKIHFGSATQCQQQPNNMVAMLLSGVDCNDANAATQIRCDKFGVFGAMPSSDLTWSNLSLNAGTTYYIVLDGTRNSQCDINILVTRATVNPVLPVLISSFEGRNDGRSNKLYWETSHESNHDFFEVEVSKDNYTYTSLGTVAGIGNVAEGQINSYDFTDYNAPFGTAYYRLKSVDIDGRFVYSKTIEVLRQSEGLELDAIYPVPMKEQVKVRLGSSTAGDASIELMDLSGHTVRNMRFYMQPGSNEAVLDVANLPAGMYIFRIRHGHETLVKKVSKL